MERGGNALDQLSAEPGVKVSVQETETASNGLRRNWPLFCCVRDQRLPSSLPGLGIVLGLIGVASPALLAGAGALILMWCFLLLILLRAVLSIYGVIIARRDGQAEAALQDPPTWPLYSVLVPVYREAGSVPGLVAGLRALAYPADRLEVLFLTEEDDTQTRAALAAEELPPYVQILSLPDGQPRTKPRALNVALERLRGEIVTIYDAEDRPHPQQLKAAARTLYAGGPGLACVQAPLYAYNGMASWLCAQWTLEYDVHFGLILPALAKLGLPIALGGTSNHFRASTLREAGGWDAWNVTEDADIGLRFARMGRQVGVIGPPTQEEAPETFSIWARQRSRWIKGYMQTWTVLMRQPVLIARQMGMMKALTSFWLLSGAIGSALLHLPCLVWLVICALSPEVNLPPLGMFVLIAGYCVSAGAAMMAPRYYPGQRIGCVLTFWLYWPLLSLAAALALFELLRTPHSWAKTPHALTLHEPLIEVGAFARMGETL